MNLYAYSFIRKKNPNRDKIYHLVNDLNYTWCGIKCRGNLKWAVGTGYMIKLFGLNKGNVCKNCLKSIKEYRKRNFLIWRFWYWLIEL